MTCCVPVITEAELPGRLSQLQGSHAGRPKFRSKCAAHSPVQTSSGSMSCCLVSGCVPGSAVQWSWRQTLSPCLGRVCRCRATVTEASDFHVPSAENKQCSSCDHWEQKVLPKPEAGSNRVHWSRPEVWLALVRDEERGAAPPCVAQPESAAAARALRDTSRAEGFGMKLKENAVMGPTGRQRGLWPGSGPHIRLFPVATLDLRTPAWEP